MRVAVGDNFARCQKCGGEEFHPATHGAPLMRDRSYVCQACHAAYLYSDLLSQSSERGRPQDP